MWAATHGGGSARATDEFRIQMTWVAPPLLHQRNAVTLLLGLSAEILTAWDTEYHTAFTAGSPSLQTSRSSMLRALQDGFGFHRKSSGEVTVSSLPEYIRAYVDGQRDLHTLPSASVVRRIQTPAAREASVNDAATPEGDADGNAGDEPAAFESVKRAIRDGSFSRRVLV